MSKKPNYAAHFDEQPADESDDFKRVFGGLKLPAGLQQKSPGALSAVDWIRQSPTALIIDTELNEAEWLDLIRSIKKIEQRYQWYIGDALVYGIDRKYGTTEAQTQQVMEITGKGRSTLYDYQRTALLFEKSERSDLLDFEQHRVLANAFPDETPEHHAARLRWLHVAEVGNLSGRKLSAEIEKAYLPAEASAGDNMTIALETPEGVTVEYMGEMGYAPALFDEIEDVADVIHEKRIVGFRKKAQQNRYAEIDLTEIVQAERWLATLRKKVAAAKIEADRQARAKKK